MNELRKISRREFMKRTGAAGGGLVFALTFASACQPDEAAVGPVAKATASVAPNVYVNIRNDGIVEIYCHRSEMGQGIRTSLPQVIADELEADWTRSRSSRPSVMRNMGTRIPTVLRASVIISTC